MTGDCPALRLILRFISHGGYYCCWFCLIRGIHVNRKRQYRYEPSIILRTTFDFAVKSQLAHQQQSKFHGHLGVSVLEQILDVPLPNSIIPDYLHISLLGHGKALLQQLYTGLKPKQRMKIDASIKQQAFPHYFNRKMKTLGNLGHVKATEVKNIIFYGLLPNIQEFISAEKLSHLALYVCFLRILHVQPIYDPNASQLADELFTEYYRDHDLYYKELQNFVLHLHRHLPDVYRMHGALSNIGCFGQEDFIGSVGSNHHGTRFFGELITFYYNIDYALQSEEKRAQLVDGPFDEVKEVSVEHNRIHTQVCSCNQDAKLCISYYKRCVINHTVFHSVTYTRKGRSNSYFVQYRDEDGHYRFGAIKFFFQLRSNHISYATVDRYDVKMNYSAYFKRSKYYRFIRKPLDSFYFVLMNYSSYETVVSINKIVKHCIVFQFVDCKVVTPISSYNEHD